MAILVLVMLLMVWAVVLGPGLWRRYSASRSVDSIHAFHRALRVLQRTGDPTVAPVHRLGVAGPSVVRADGRPALLLVRPDSPAATARSPRAVERGRGHVATDPFFRADACKRRRDVFLGLVASVVGSGILGAIPPLHPLLAVMVVAVMALVAYVVLLVRLRAAAAERRARQQRRASEAVRRQLADTGEIPVYRAPEARVAAR